MFSCCNPSERSPSSRILYQQPANFPLWQGLSVGDSARKGRERRRSSSLIVDLRRLNSSVSFPFIPRTLTTSADVYTCFTRDTVGHFNLIHRLCHPISNHAIQSLKISHRVRPSGRSENDVVNASHSSQVFVFILQIVFFVSLRSCR